MRERFSGRVAVITGGSSGIGLATAEALARRGVTVVIVARGVGDVKCAVQKVRDHNGTAYGYRCDVTDHYAVSALAKTVLKEHGPVDFLINSAGKSIRRAVVSSTDRLHDYERIMAVNYFGAVDMILAFLPSMRERGSGHVVNISSIAVQTKAPLFSAYVASKSALDAFSVVAAAENAAAGVCFTSIRMPLVRTPMIAPTSDFATLPVDTPEQAAARVVRALAERPDRIDTPVGTLAEYLGFVALRFSGQSCIRSIERFPNQMPPCRPSLGVQPQAIPHREASWPRRYSPRSSHFRHPESGLPGGCQGFTGDQHGPAGMGVVPSQNVRMAEFDHRLVDDQPYRLPFVPDNNVHA
ncbi:MAG: SDR family NAD(P)-dependent oxidoreductase [Thermoguttaceae bacterium]